MMDSPELIILDVGHGNCAILRDTAGAMIIDCAPGPTLIEALVSFGIHEISYVLISHADEDHIAGIIALLAHKDIKIHHIYLNPDSVKQTKIWQALRIALQDARRRAEVDVHTELNSSLTKRLSVGEVEIEILAPTPEIVLGGSGSNDLHGHPLVSNSISVVLGFVHSSHRVALLAGDIDEVGLTNLHEDCTSANASVIVFPHHGGKPGSGNGYKFAQVLCDIVKPKSVVISLGRNRLSNPTDDVIQGILSICPKAHIICTQLSKRCAPVISATNPPHLLKVPAMGRACSSCCGGSIVVKMRGEKSFISPSRNSHGKFVRSTHITSPVCLQALRKDA